ncbi:ATP-binding protein [Amycolatopsis alkalitolerans]|uniref:ATP-binding protein n=1 Tax=Amycolatopsis alkalitolerans TaxID=2547244 RepID=A0A5C4LSF6_9PSEU|nr:ATP-binding protein [Amycolatopsis alkalitolerans]TNC21901.1 ATP-binding protein [Amycolatopsis alkalitolerans]
MRSSAEIVLARSPEAPRAARRFVSRVCVDWRIAGLTAEAETVTSELVENTLEHTESIPKLRLELYRGLLVISVSDDSPHPAYIRAGGTTGGFGMVLVERTARDWGCTPSPDGGKTVWARLASRSPRPYGRS